MTEGSSPNIYCSIEHPPLKWNGLEFTIHEHGVAKRGQYRVKQQRYGGRKYTICPIDCGFRRFRRFINGRSSW